MWRRLSPESGIVTDIIAVTKKSSLGAYLKLKSPPHRKMEARCLKSARHFHMSSLFLHSGLAEHIPQLFSLLKDAELTTSLDTNDDPEDKWGGALCETLKYVDVILLNERQAKKICREGRI